MIKNDKIIKELIYGDIIEQIAEQRNISLHEAKEEMTRMTFSEYVKLIEATANIMPPSGQTPQVNMPNKPGMQQSPANSKSVAPNNQMQQANTQVQPPAMQPPQTGNPSGPVQPPELDANGNPIIPDDIQRLKELAGIGEESSGGSTSAGNFAVPEASLKKEYVRRAPAKTIIGDTKPFQASGELSANLAATGKPSAGRTNNGFKR